MKIKPLLLSLGIAAVFALSCVPGAVAYNTCANGVVVTHFYDLFHSADFVGGIPAAKAFS